MCVLSIWLLYLYSMSLAFRYFLSDSRLDYLHGANGAILRPTASVLWAVQLFLSWVEKKKKSWFSLVCSVLVWLKDIKSQILGCFTQNIHILTKGQNKIRTKKHLFPNKQSHPYPNNSPFTSCPVLMELSREIFFFFEPLSSFLARTIFRGLQRQFWLHHPTTLLPSLDSIMRRLAGSPFSYLHLSA